jgi:hypothetical protein
VVREAGEEVPSAHGSGSVPSRRVRGQPRGFAPTAYAASSPASTR